MKILQISNYFYPHIGGIEQTARDIECAIDDKTEQEVICFSSDNKDEQSVVDGVKITYVGCFAKISSQSLSTHYGTKLKEKIDSFKPDVIIFHYPNPFVAHFLLKQLKKNLQIKLVLYWHLDIVKQKILGKFFGRQTENLCRRAVKIVATSPNYIEGSKQLSKYKEKCVVISSCVQKEIFIKTPQIEEKVNMLRADADGKIVLFAVGRHVPYKGMEYLLKASKFLSDDYIVCIGGEGELTKKLKKLAEGDEKIKFLGEIPREDIATRFYACDIFCFPSITKNEAFGIALAEALYCGKPAVTFTINGSGVNYVSVNGVTGLEVENGNAKAFADAIKKIAEDEKLKKQFGENARRRAEELFTFDTFKENIQTLLKSIERESGLL